MTEPKFTPAPWKVCKQYGFFEVWKGSGDDAIEVAAIRHIPNDHNHEEEEANANLIAAARDLHDALQKMKDIFDAELHDVFPTREYKKEVFEVAIKALAKARGET